MSSDNNNCDSDSADMSDSVPPVILKAAKEIALNSLPSISKQKYTKVYNEFKKWRNTKNTKSFAESVSLVYFNETSQSYASSTLWSKFSMLKATIKAYDNIDIGKYVQLLGFLKKRNAGYRAKKSKIFSTTDVSKFLKEAPDAQYLVMKVGESSESIASVALHDTLENVSKNLRISDLMHLGEVCRSWKQIAARELSIRGLEQAVLPDIYNTNVSFIHSNFHMYELLNTKPHVGIFFVSPDTNRRYCEELEDRIVVAYKRFFPNHLVAVGVAQSMMDENAIRSAPSSLGRPNGILGLFIPQNKAIQVKVSSFRYTPLQDLSVYTTQLLNDLMIDSNRKSTIILIGVSRLGQIAAKNALDLIKNRLVQQRYSLWGGVYNDTLVYSNTNSNGNREAPTLFALSLSGPNLRSWSIVLKCRTPKNEFHQSLLMFKNSLDLARNSIGLVCAPKSVIPTDQVAREDMYSDSNELMAAVKDVFPNIPFIGTFILDFLPQIGVDSTSEDDNQQLLHRESLSLMILSHD